MLQSYPERERTLIDRFQSVVRRKATVDLDLWLTEAAPSLIASFVRGVEKGLTAVRATVAEPWSNGQTEGHVGRLKLVNGRCTVATRSISLKRRFSCT